jgi:hypothetical protein
MQVIAEEEDFIGLWPIRTFGFIQQTFKPTNVSCEGIGVLLKFVKLVFSFLNLIKVGIDAGELVQNNIIVVNILGN